MARGKPKTNRKTNRRYIFSVEGQTEQWYLNWLQKVINKDPNKKFSVIFECKIEKNPISMVKSIAISGRTEIVHMIDRESETKENTKKFSNILMKMQEAQSIGKDVKYILGYSNLSFELWIILHRLDCNGQFTKCDDYLKLLNEAYSSNFENLKSYKNERKFQEILKQLSIEDVISAIKRAKHIQKNNSRVHKLCSESG